jgi:hypothetical protein
MPTATQHALQVPECCWLHLFNTGTTIHQLLTCRPCHMCPLQSGQHLCTHTSHLRCELHLQAQQQAVHAEVTAAAACSSCSCTWQRRTIINQNDSHRSSSMNRRGQTSEAEGCSMQLLLLVAGSAVAAALEAHCRAPDTNPLSGSSIFGSRGTAAAIAQADARQQAPASGLASARPSSRRQMCS